MPGKVSKTKRYAKRVWKFLWHDDSAASWLANLLIAFLVIRFLLYPLLGIVLGTNFPIVAVVSESMEHGTHNNVLCGKHFEDFQDSFANYWEACGNWYEQQGVSQADFREFPLTNGFDKGDVVILWRANSNNIQVGDVLVFQADRAQPIIHRVVKIWQEDNQTFYQTKGDHNANSIGSGLRETKISENRVYGKGIIRLPYLGWLKIIFVDFMRIFGISITR